MSEERLAYRFGPLERRGLLGPVSAGQAAVLAAAAILAVVVLDHAPNPLGGLLAVSVLAAAVPIALAPVARRSLSEWLPIAARMGIRRVTGRRRFISPVATAGVRARPHPTAVPRSYRRPLRTRRLDCAGCGFSNCPIAGGGSERSASNGDAA